MLQKLQSCLSEYTVEIVSLSNIDRYESVFYSNDEYYRLTDGHPATRKDCVDTIEYGADDPSIYNIGVSKNGEPVAFLSVVAGYPQTTTLYIGLLLIHKIFKRQSVRTKIISALRKIAYELNFSDMQLSVQDNNIAGYSFWKKVGFCETAVCPCDGFNNLSMRCEINYDHDLLCAACTAEL